MSKNLTFLFIMITFLIWITLNQYLCLQVGDTNLDTGLKYNFPLAEENGRFKRNAPPKDIESFKEYETIKESPLRPKNTQTPFYVSKLSKKNTIGESGTLKQIKKLLGEMYRQVDLLEELHMDHKKIATKLRNDHNFPINSDNEIFNRGRRKPEIPKVLDIEKEKQIIPKSHHQLVDNSHVEHTEEGTGRKNVRQNENQGIWGTWTDWSACSVTCGKGRVIRWRHCRAAGGCDGIETEMGEKACQLPACSPGKFFGIF